MKRTGRHLSTTASLMDQITQRDPTTTTIPKEWQEMLEIISEARHPPYL